MSPNRTKIEKGAQHPRRPVGTLGVPIGTLRVLTGPLGCRAPFSILVRFGLLFGGFLSQEMHLDAFLIHILKINPFFWIFRSLK